MKALRIVFFGSPSFAVPSLEALLGAGHDVALVVTQPDRPTGRGQRMAAPPVADFARTHGLPLWQTPTLKGEEALARLGAVHADAMALAAFAALVPRALLELAPTGILNVHPSLLPRWRGAAPIQAALLAGDHETGVTIIRLVAAMDAGPILLQERVPILPADDYLTLEPRLAERGGRLLVRALQGIQSGALTPVPQQDEAATCCRKIQREDARIDWRQPAELIWRQVRAYRGWPQAYTTWEGQTLKLLRVAPVPSSGHQAGVVTLDGRDMVVATGSGGLRIDQLTLEGKRPQSGQELLRGHPRIVGARLGDADERARSAS